MSNRFEWTRVMHETKRRHLIVLRTELVAPRMQRITLGGAELEGFTSLAPGDHVKAFFPDPSVGEIVTPVIVDGRNVFNPADMQKMGFIYHSIGRP